MSDAGAGQPEDTHTPHEATAGHHGTGDHATGFWRAGPDLARFATEPFAADDPAALPRRLGPLPGDEDGGATRELHRLYGLLADEAEREALA